MRIVLTAIGSGLLLGCALAVEHPAASAVDARPRPPVTSAPPVVVEPVMFFQGLMGCTASLVGHRVVLTAAHCVADRAGLANRLRKPPDLVRLAEEHRFPIPGVGTARGTCVVHGDYVRTGRGDLALCQTTSIPGVRPLRVSTDAALIARNTPLILEGLGFLDQLKRRPLRQLRATVRSSSVADLIRTGNDPILPGDSGGPALARVGNGRVVVGVISRGNSREGDLVPLAGPVSGTLLSLWSASASNAPICGLNDKGCSP